MDRKAEILTHAADLLQTRGYSAFSYSDLAKRLGIRKASIHHHFCNKEALGEALVQRYVDGIQAFRDDIDQRGGDSWTKLKAIFAHGACMAEHKTCPGGSLHSQWSVLPDAVKDRLKTLDDTMRDWVAQILDDGRSAGLMKFEGEARDQAVMVLAAMQGALQHARVHGRHAYDAVVSQVERSMRP